MSIESEILRIAMNMGPWPGIFVSAGLFIRLTCGGIAQVVLARQGKSTAPLTAPSRLTEQPIPMILFASSGALAAALVSLLR
jgi:hypothetical protein